MIMGPRNVNSGPCIVIIRTCYVIMGPLIVNKVPWNVNRGHAI